MINNKNKLILIFFALIYFSTSHATVCFEEKKQLPLQEVSELGFSGQDLLDTIVPGEQSENWEWEYKDGKTQVIVAVKKMADFARYVKKTASDKNDPAISCLSYLEVDVRMDIKTADNTFNESFITTILKTEPLANSQPVKNSHMWHKIKGKEFIGDIRQELGEQYADSEFYFYANFNLDYGFIMTAFTFISESDESPPTYVSIGGTRNI